jgi:hypothetical protein
MVLCQHSKVELGVSHLPLHQPCSKEHEAARKRMELFHDKTHIKESGKTYLNNNFHQSPN